jgi:hypothetical protein
LRKKLGMKSNTAAVEEVLADMTPADLVKLKGWRKLVGMARDWFQSHGFTSLANRLDTMMKAGLTEQQQADMLVAEVVNAARNWVKGGKQAAKARSGTALANATRPSRTPEANSPDGVTRFSHTNKATNQDAAYLDAVRRGDVETLQAMVNAAAETAGVPIINEQDVTAYHVRRVAPPKNTVKAYKLFRVKRNQKGEVFALFVGANDPLPQNVWLDAIAGPNAGTNKSGGPMVKSKLGPLSYRPGWHAGDIPLATHIGAKQDKSSPIIGRKEDEVWAEVDVAADDNGRYQKEADANGTRPNGKFVVGDADIKYMPENGMYRYKTNPNMTGQWIISGSMKINRILSESEVNKILHEANMPTMPWTQDTGAKVNPYVKAPLDLARWGLNTNPAVNQKKLLDPITYDDAGNVIPLSQRFNKASADPRFSRASQTNHRQPPLPGVNRPTTPTPPNQAGLGLQGGVPGNRASWNSPEESVLDNYIFKLQDKHIDLKRATQAIKAAGAVLQDRWNAYMQEELFHGRTAKRTKDFADKELAPMMHEMKQRGLTLEALDTYLWARHAPEANALIRQRDPNMPDGGSGLTDAQARAILAGTNTVTAAGKPIAGIDVSKRADLEAIAAMSDAIIAGTRDLYIDYALESRDVVDDWSAMFKHYVPLMREDHDGGMGIGQGFSIKGREAKHRTGSTAGVIDILANIAVQRERAIVRGEKNRVAIALAGLVKLNPNPDFWTLDRIPKERVLNEKTGLVETREVPNYRSRDNVVMVKIKNGSGVVHEHVIVLNEDNERAVRLAKAMKNIDIPVLEGLTAASAVVTRYFASINTQYNPVFGFVNLTRDIGAAALNLKSTPMAGKAREILAPKRLGSALLGIYRDQRLIRKGQTGTSPWSALWEDFTREGGQTGYRDMFGSSADRSADLRSMIDPMSWTQSKWGKFFSANGRLNVPLSVAQKSLAPVFRWLDDFNLTMENAVRLSAYKSSIDAGMSKQQAASLAKNLTVNFNRKGAYGTQIGAFYAFFNAATQGTARIGETMLSREVATGKYSVSALGKKIAYGGIMLGAVQALVLAMAGYDDDEPPEFIRERNLIIPLPGTDGKYIAIPMPLGYHIFPNIGRKAMEYTLGRGGSLAETTTELIGSIFEAFNPIGSAGLSMQTIAPTILDPFAALSENKDWTGKPIAKVDFNSLAPTPGFTRARDNASAISTAIAEGVNAMTGGGEYAKGVISPTPDQIDYLFGQVTGGVGREANKLYQTVEAQFTGDDLPPHKIPLAGRFYGDVNSQSAQRARYYDNLKEMSQHKAEIVGRIKDGDVAGKNDYLADHPESRLYSFALSTEDRISQMRAMRRTLLKRGVTGDRVDAIDENINQAMNRVNERIDAVTE